MIYTIYFAGVPALTYTPQYYGEGTFPPEEQLKFYNKNLRTMLAKAIKESPQHTFIFITTIGQTDQWDAFVNQNDLKDYITFEPKRAITNGNHNDQGRRLYLHVLKGKK